ncbi:hypothetical protein [Clostridium senegalense]
MENTHGKQWSEDEVKEEIFKVMEFLNIETMPSNSELIKVTKNYSLSNKIARSGGFKFWAKKLGLELKESDSKFGWKGEKIIFDLLTKKQYKVERMSVRYPFDLLVNENIKIDVKTANRHSPSNAKYYFHTFNLEKKNPTCDIYVCLAFNNENLEKLLIIPSKFLRKTQLSIGKESQYDKYINRWDYIEEYDKFYKSIS